MNSNHENIVRCRTQFEQAIGLLTIGLEDGDASLISDSIDAYADLISLCAASGLYSAITDYQAEYRAALSGKKEYFIASIKAYKDRQNLLERMCQTIGTYSTGNLLEIGSIDAKKTGSHKTVHDHATLYRSKLHELLYIKDPENIQTYKIDLLAETREGHHQSVIDAITFASSIENGAQILSKMRLWAALSDYTPKKRTKHNHLKLPDSIKKALIEHESMVTSALLLETAGKSTGVLSTPIVDIWVARELFDYGMHDLAAKALDITTNTKAVNSLSSLSRNEKSHRNISSIWMMGEEMYARKLSLFANAADSVFAIVSSVVCQIELKNYSSSDLEFTLKSFHSKNENHSKTLRANHLWMALHELIRAYPDNANVDPSTRAKIDILEGFVADFLPSINDPYLLRNIKEHAADVFERIINNPRYRRATLVEGMGL